MFNLDNKIRVNITDRDNNISTLTEFFFIKMRLIVHNINFNNLIDYIINIIIVKHRFFTINKMIIKHFKKYINHIKMNILIIIKIHFLFYKRSLKINCISSFFKINH